jgi:hypothetical protein
LNPNSSLDGDDWQILITNKRAIRSRCQVLVSRDYRTFEIHFSGNRVNPGTVSSAVQKKYGQWNFFKYFAKRNILDVEAELSGKKKIPQSPAAP